MQSSPKHFQAKKEEKKQAYLFVYEEDENKQMRVLLGQKKVICYKALEKLERKPDQFADLIPIILEKRWHKLMETRAHGLFFYAGGRPTAFGGSRERNESAEHGAAREFLEEIGIKHLHPEKEAELIQEMLPHLKPLPENPHFPGTYFSLDLSKCPKLKPYLTDEAIVDENNRIQQDIKEEKKPLSVRQQTKLALRSSEMQFVGWVPLKDMVAFLQTNAYGNELVKEIEQTIIQTLKFLFRKLGLTEKHEMFNPCRNFVLKQVKDETILDTIEAAKELTKTLNEQHQDKDVKQISSPEMHSAFFKQEAEDTVNTVQTTSKRQLT